MTIACFWCGTLLNKKTKTRDHLVSRPLARKLKIKRQPVPGSNSWVVASCSLCNNNRAIVTCLYNTAIGRMSIRRKKSKSKTCENMALVYQFRLLVARKLTGVVRHLCLTEIDTVLIWAAHNGFACKRCGGLVRSENTVCETCPPLSANEIS